METLSLSCPSPKPRAFALLGSGPVGPSWYSVVHTSHWKPGHRQICPESGPRPIMLIAQVSSLVLPLGSTAVRHIPQTPNLVYESPNVYDKTHQAEILAGSG